MVHWQGARAQLVQRAGRRGRREVEEGKWSEGADRRALLVRSRRAHGSEVPGVLGWAPRVWAARGIRPGKRGRGGGDGLAAGCWAASGKKGKRAGLGCRLGLGRVGVGFGLGSFLFLSPFYFYFPISNTTQI